MTRAVRIGLAVGIPSLLAVIGIAIAFVVASSSDSPRRAAETYLDALSTGDIDGVRTVVADPWDDAPTDAAFAAAAALLEEPRIDAESVSGDTAMVRASGRIAEEEVSLDIALTRTADGWRVEDPRVDVDLSSDLGDVVAVGDAILPVGATPLLPAQYVVRAAPTDILTGESSAVVVGPTAVHVAATLAPGAAAAVQPALDSYADACASPATTVSDACGLRIPWAADLTTTEPVSFAFRIEAYPQVALDAEDLTFGATGGRLVVTATGTGRSGGADAVTYLVDPWALRGTLAFEGDQLVLHVAG